MANVRNEQRRGQILDAAIRIIGREGPGAMTHRAVAAEAGVPLAATTYYFASKEELFNAALIASVQSDLADLESLARSVSLLPASAETAADSLARFLANQLASRRVTCIAQYELVLEAARQPELRSAASATTAAYVALCETLLEKVGAADPGTDARLLVAVMDGLLLDQLAAPVPAYDADALADLLRRFIGRLVVVPQ
jgi:DNA-binding transcriptional regulator YbjK